MERVYPSPEHFDTRVVKYEQDEISFKYFQNQAVLEAMYDYLINLPE